MRKMRKIQKFCLIVENTDLDVLCRVTCTIKSFFFNTQKWAK